LEEHLKSKELELQERERILLEREIVIAVQTQHSNMPEPERKPRGKNKKGKKFRKYLTSGKTNISAPTGFKHRYTVTTTPTDGGEGPIGELVNPPKSPGPQRLRLLSLEQQKISEKKVKTWGPNSTPYKKNKGRKERANFDRMNSNENSMHKNTRSSSFPNLHRINDRMNRPETSDPNIAAKDPLFDSLPPGQFPTDASPLSPSRPRVRYLAICQAGILAAAICGIDLTDAWDPEAELNLEKKEKKDSVGSRETVSLSNTPIGNRRKNHNGGHRSTSTSEFGTYRRRRDDDFEYMNDSNINLVNSTNNKSYELSSTSDISTANTNTTPSFSHSTSLPYNDTYSEQDTIHFRGDMYSQPSANAAQARFRRVSSENQVEVRQQQSKSASPIRRVPQPASDQFDSKPQRPKTLNVTPDHKVAVTTQQEQSSQQFQRFNVSKANNTVVYPQTFHAFTNSNTSSSSQSPASTPGSPKPVGRLPMLKDIDRIDNVSSMPARIHQYPGGGTANSNRPRAQSAFNQPAVINNQSGSSQPSTPKHIAFI